MKNSQIARIASIVVLFWTILALALAVFVAEIYGVAVFFLILYFALAYRSEVLKVSEWIDEDRRECD